MTSKSKSHICVAVFRPRAYATYQEALKCDFENWRIWENLLAVSNKSLTLMSLCGCQHFQSQVDFGMFTSGGGLDQLVTSLVASTKLINAGPG